MHWRDRVWACLCETERGRARGERGGRESNVIRWQLTAESCNHAILRDTPENRGTKYFLEQDLCFYTVSHSKHTDPTSYIYTARQQQGTHAWAALFVILKDYKMSIIVIFSLCWYILCQMCSNVLLQLCLISILGFILYCVTYLPDERTSMQFICKVSLHVCVCSSGSEWQPVTSRMEWSQAPH